MRHNRRTARLGRNHSERRALLENLVSSLLDRQEITTTLQKAKEAKRLADRVISLGKRDSLAARRQVFSYLQDHQLTSRVFKEVAPRFQKRNGGYTRILHLDRRKGDGAQLALLELTEKEIKVKAAKPKAHKGKAAAGDKGHAHDAETGHPKGTHEHPEKETHRRETPGEGKEKQQKGFFRNIGRFFRNKGGG